MKWSKFLGAAAVVALLAGTANAELVTSGSAAFDVFGSCNTTTGCTGGIPTNNLGAELVFSNFTFTTVGSTVTFSTNITASNIGTGPSTDRLTAFGFNTIPDATGGSSNSTVFNLTQETTFPSFMTVDVCESSGPTCAGGANGGLSPGGTNSFTLSLTGLPLGTISLDLGTDVAGGSELFDFKFQTALGSFETSGSPCIPGTPGCVLNPPAVVPEPGSLVLLGTFFLVLAGVAWFIRGRKQDEQEYADGGGMAAY